MKKIDLYKFNDFTLGQAIGYLRASEGLLDSVVEYGFGIKPSDRELIRQAIEIIRKVEKNYGE